MPTVTKKSEQYFFLYNLEIDSNSTDDKNKVKLIYRIFKKCINSYIFNTIAYVLIDIILKMLRHLHRFE